MVDAWLRMIALMEGAFEVPAVRWPPARRRVVRGIAGAGPADTDDDAALIADHLQSAGVTASAAVADALGLTRAATMRHLHALEIDGVICRASAADGRSAWRFKGMQPGA